MRLLTLFVIGIELRALCLLSRYSELHLQPWCVYLQSWGSGARLPVLYRKLTYGGKAGDCKVLELLWENQIVAAPRNARELERRNPKKEF